MRLQTPKTKLDKKKHQKSKMEKVETTAAPIPNAKLKYQTFDVTKQ